MANVIKGEAAGPTYPKINSLWKRHPQTKRIMRGQYAMPELELLADVQWWWYEKIDGTNIRLHWDGERVLIGGRTNNAQIPATLYGWLADNIPAPEVWAEQFDGPVTVYGEGFGAGIQSGAAYGDPRFIVFDVRVHDEVWHDGRLPGGGWWLRWEDVEGVAENLGFDTVPFLGTATIERAEYNVMEDKIESRWPNVLPEGIVGRPKVELHTRRGERILVKIKRVDYKNIFDAKKGDQ